MNGLNINNRGQLSGAIMEDTEIKIDPDMGQQSERAESQEALDPVRVKNEGQGNDWITKIK